MIMECFFSPVLETDLWLGKNSCIVSCCCYWLIIIIIMLVVMFDHSFKLAVVNIGLQASFSSFCFFLSPSPYFIVIKACQLNVKSEVDPAYVLQDSVHSFHHNFC